MSPEGATRYEKGLKLPAASCRESSMQGKGLFFCSSLANFLSGLWPDRMRSLSMFKGSRIQVRGVEVKTLGPSNPGILEPNLYCMNPRSSLMGILFSVFFFFFAAVCACYPAQAYKNPEVELKKVRITQINPEAVVLEGTLEIFNPNDLGLRFSGYDYQLTVEGQRLITGESDRPFEIGAQKSSIITLPAVIRFADLSALLEKDLFTRDIAYLLSGTVHLKSWIGTFDFPFSNQGTFNLSDLMREKAREFLPRP